MMMTQPNVNHDACSLHCLSFSMHELNLTQMSKVASALLSGKYSSPARPDESMPDQREMAPVRRLFVLSGIRLYIVKWYLRAVLIC